MSTELQQWIPPTIAELTDNLELAAKNDVLNIALNNDPPAKWIKQHPLITIRVGDMLDSNGNVMIDGNGNPKGIFEPLKYIPIDKQRFLGRRFFGTVEEEILREGVMFQSVYVTVRLNYKHPITGEPLHMDGIGAVGVQTDKGASAADLSKIKSDAIMKALPAAKSYAIKNAYDSIGRIFGGEIQKGALQFNEANAMYVKSFYDAPNVEDLTELFEMKREALSPDDIANAERIINNNETKSFTKLYDKLSKA